MTGLLVLGVIVACLLYAADRIVKARVQARRLRAMSERLAAAAARAEEQHEERRAEAAASAALTSYLPAINRPARVMARQAASGERDSPDAR
jgi:hypothetical protein